jgi:hypothetical protein
MKAEFGRLDKNPKEGNLDVKKLNQHASAASQRAPQVKPLARCAGRPRQEAYFNWQGGF